MDKIKRMVLVAGLMICMCITPFSVMANESNNEKEFSIKGEYIVDDKGYKYSEFVTADGTEIPLDEAILILNGESNSFERNNSNNISTCGLVGIDNGVTITKIQRNYVGKEQRLTPEIMGPGTIKHIRLFARKW